MPKKKQSPQVQYELGFIIIEEVSISYRYKLHPSQRPQVNCSKDAYEIFKAVWDFNKIDLQEDFKVILLNRSNRVLGVASLFTGGVSGAVVDVKLIFVVALKAMASCIIVAHNHPSGNLKPSSADEIMVKKIASAGQLLDIKVTDSLIISSEGFLSFADEGLL